MFCMDLNCLSVSGMSAARTTTVSATIAHPQARPTVSWKNRRIASKKSISGWRTLAKGTTGQGRCGSVRARRAVRRRSRGCLGARTVAPQSLDELSERLADAGHALALGELTCLGPRNDDVVGPLRQAIRLRPERLAQDSLHATAVHGSAHTARYREAQPGSVAVVDLLLRARERVQQKEAVALGASLPIDALELGATGQPAPLRAPPAARAPAH